MKIRVTTASGIYYDIDLEHRLFERNGDGNEVSIVEWRSGDSQDHRNSPVTEWDHVGWPILGESMYIQGEGLANWYLTTPVTQINEIDEPDSGGQALTGEMRVFPSGYTLQVRSEHKTNFWDKVFGRKTPEWQDILVSAEKSQIERYLSANRYEATWES